MEYAKLQHKCCLKIWSFRQMNKSQHKLRTRWKSAQKMWRCMNPKNETWSIWLQILIRMLQNFLLSHELYFWFYICNQIMRNTRKTGDWFENFIYIPGQLEQCWKNLFGNVEFVWPSQGQLLNLLSLQIQI